MKIRRSARTILVTLLVLTVFTLLTVWHNKVPDQLTEKKSQALISQLGTKAPRFIPYFEKMKAWHKSQGIYVLAVDDQQIWPEKLTRACYADPLVAKTLTMSLKMKEAKKIEAMRYRSVEDFLVLVNQAEERTPGTLKTMNRGLYVIAPEPAFTASLRLLFSILLGITGLVIVKFNSK